MSVMRRTLLVVLLFGVLAVTIVPAYGWVIPPNPAGEDYKYELFGPHIKGINITIYSGTTSEWIAMDAGQLDLEDWVLDGSHYMAWETPAGPFTVANYSGEAGYFLWDINNNATYQLPTGGPYIHNPTSELLLRRAIAACVNRSYMVDYTGGLVLPIYTPVPAYMAGYINPSVPTYGGYVGNLTFANQLLDNNGYTVDGNGWRIDPVSQGGTGAELNLVIYSRQGDRNILGNDLNAMLNAVKIKTTYYPNTPRAQVTGPVFANETFNLYTGGWTGIGPDPDFICDLYNGSNYYHPGSPPNYDNVNYPETNANATTVKLAPTIAVGTAACLDFQYWFAYYAAAVPVWSYSGVKAYRNAPVEGGGNWTNLVNEKRIGVNSWWSTLDMRQVGNEYPNNYTHYGFSTTVTTQNVVYAQWYWDTEVLSRIYDRGYARDPYTLQWTVPQLYKNYVVGSWIDAVTHEIKTSVTVTLRPDAYWQDGQPVTLADVYYTLVEIRKDLLAKGFPPPSWYPTVQYMRSVQIVDPYTIQILLDVQSVWAAGWVIGSTIIPKHIWKPIVDASTLLNPVIQGNTPDANIIGTGPFRWVSGLGDTVSSTVVLAANTPGSIVNNVTSPGYYLYEPVYADINPPNGQSKINISSTDSSANISVALTLRNIWTEGNLTVSEYVYVHDMAGNPYLGSGLGGLMPGYPLSINLVPVLPYPNGTSNVEALTLTLPKHSSWFVKVAAQITGPPTILDTQSNPWLSQWVNVTLPIWVTIKQDIEGTTLYDVLGYTSYPSYLKKEAPAPDLKVDVIDIALAAKAFGTIPGSPAWNPVADVNGDFKIDMKDLANIGKQFGY
jgi:ABC-type transport system substrate-binding protein